MYELFKEKVFNFLVTISFMVKKVLFFKYSTHKENIVKDQVGNSLELE